MLRAGFEPAIDGSKGRHACPGYTTGAHPVFSRRLNILLPNGYYLRLVKGAVDGFKARANGWLLVKVGGSPRERGYAYGYMLAREMLEAVMRFRLYAEKVYGLGWSFFREAAEKLYAPKLPEELVEEMEGMVEGAGKRRVMLDFMDLVTFNGFFDTLSYHRWLKGKPKGVPKCSAMLAAGDATKDGGIILAHSTWFAYMLAPSCNLIVAVTSESGNSFVMQSVPGFVMSGMDWYLNSAGLMVAETTIAGVKTFNPEGSPYFSRVRMAIQYSSGIEEFVNWMTEDNNGGYANGWLIGDSKSGEIAYLELATYRHALTKTRSGWFFGSNIAFDEGIREEVEFDFERPSPPTSRRERWLQLVREHYGRLDLELAKRLIADHIDPYTGKRSYRGRTICGHLESDPEGWPEWEVGPYSPFGTFDAKVTDGELAKTMSFWAHWGRPCGRPFRASSYLSRHEEYSWQEAYLDDLIPFPWTRMDPMP